MTIGIYALYWEEQDLIYIGQSQNIESRFKEHIRKLKNNYHTNYKVTEAYNLYGNPSVQIIEICSLDDLNQLEIFWTKEFNSLHGSNGLNIIEAGSVGYGAYSNSSVYTKWQILKVFSLLRRIPVISYKLISIRTKVKTHTISDIVNGKSHLWISTEYPEKYLELKTLVQQRLVKSYGTAKNIGKIYPAISDSLGNIYTNIENLSEFCRNIPEFTKDPEQARKGLSRLLSGKLKSYIGWKVIKESNLLG